MPRATLGFSPLPKQEALSPPYNELCSSKGQPSGNEGLYMPTPLLSQGGLFCQEMQGSGNQMTGNALEEGPLSLLCEEPWEGGGGSVSGPDPPAPFLERTVRNH